MSRCIWIVILFLQIICLHKTQGYFHQEIEPVFVKEGDNITIPCFSQSDEDARLAWYKHKAGQIPEQIATFYKFDKDPKFYNEFENNARFSMVKVQDKFELHVKRLELSDSATYYCGSAHYTRLKFVAGTEIIVKASQSSSISVLQQPVMELLHPGDNVTLQCTVLTQSCAGEHSVYWLRHGSGKSHPGIIYTHRDRSDQCKNSSKAGSSTQSCVYSLPMSNISTLDVGNYYCAVSACGEILFGNGTKLDFKGKCSLWNPIVLASAISNIIFLCLIVILGGLLMIYRQKWANQTANLNQNEDTTVVNYASLSFADRPSNSRRPVRKTNHEPSLYAQVKINQQ